MEKLIWSKKGRIFNPLEFKNWNKTHAQVPYYINIDGKEKIFFTSRPEKQFDGTYVSHIHSVDVKVNGSNVDIIKLQQAPLLSLGNLGTFDESGTMPCSIVKHPVKDELWMYYVGWSRKFKVPYENAIGLAISYDKGESFKKISEGPLLAANILEPFILGCPRVYLFNNKWYMFYLGGVKWLEAEDKKESVYKLKVSVSDDGINWKRDDKYIIEEKYVNECQTCASIFEINNEYHMLFTYRHSIDFRNPERGYRIGYAVSKDLMEWERNDEKGNFEPESSGWDSEMVCYPNVFQKDGKYFMLYCGNKFGREGFGIAELLKY